MPTAPTPIEAPPTVPDRADRATFPMRMYNFFVYLVGAFYTGITALAANVFGNATEAAESAGTATAAASAAGDAAAAAIAAADEATAAVASLPDGTINDAIISPTDAWSSEKVAEELAAVDTGPFANQAALAQVQAIALCL